MDRYFTHLTILVVILVMSAIYERPIRYNKLCAVEDGSASFYLGPITPWLIVFGYLSLLAGMRSGMNDTGLYIHSFNNASPSWEALGNSLHGNIKWIGESSLTILFKMFISQDYHVWFLTWAVIESCLFVNVLRRESVSFLDACFFFFASHLYWNYFSMLRQWMAVAITFWGIRYLCNGKVWKYIFICLIAAVFHFSAIAMIPLFFLVQGKPWKGKQTAIITIFSVGLLFLSPLMSSLENITEGTVYDYAIQAMNAGNGSSIIRAIIAAVPVVLAFAARKDMDSTDPVIDVCVNMSLLNLLLNILASFTSGLFVIRFSIYTSIYNAILFPYLLNVSYRYRNRKVLKLLFYVFYFVFYIYQLNYSNAWIYKSDILTFLTNY